MIGSVNPFCTAKESVIYYLREITTIDLKQTNVTVLLVEAVIIEIGLGPHRIGNREGLRNRSSPFGAAMTVGEALVAAKLFLEEAEKTGSSRKKQE